MVLPGNLGLGKSRLASLLAKSLNCRHIAIDKIGHEASSNFEILDKLCQIFGVQILNADGTLNRKKLGNIVFADEKSMKILEELTLGYMYKCIDDVLLQKDEVIILEWILLPTSKYWDTCDFKILITSDNNARKRKVLERDNISEEYFDKRDSASLDYSPFKFDYIFENDYQEETMNKFVENLKENLDIRRI